MYSPVLYSALRTWGVFCTDRPFTFQTCFDASEARGEAPMADGGGRDGANNAYALLSLFFPRPVFILISHFTFHISHFAFRIFAFCVLHFAFLLLGIPNSPLALLAFLAFVALRHDQRIHRHLLPDRMMGDDMHYL